MSARLERAPVILALMALTAAAGDLGHHWSYSGAQGPAHWGGTCRTGKTQSPIEIRTDEANQKKLPPLIIDYRPTTLHIIDNGHTI